MRVLRYVRCFGKVSDCSKTSDSDSLGGIQTDGQLEAVFQKRKKDEFANCPEKNINFDLPSFEGFDHGQVLIVLRGEFQKEPSIKIYGIENAGMPQLLKLWVTDISILIVRYSCITVKM